MLRKDVIMRGNVTGDRGCIHRGCTRGCVVGHLCQYFLQKFVQLIFPHLHPVFHHLLHLSHFFFEVFLHLLHAVLDEQLYGGVGREGDVW